jgi:hypothetical protein
MHPKNCSEERSCKVSRHARRPKTPRKLGVSKRPSRKEYRHCPADFGRIRSEHAVGCALSRSMLLIQLISEFLHSLPAVSASGNLCVKRTDTTSPSFAAPAVRLGVDTGSLGMSYAPVRHRRHSRWRVFAALSVCRFRNHRGVVTW